MIFMQELLYKLKNFLKWLFRWLKYIIIIILGFIYSLFQKEKTVKLEKIKQENRPIKKEKPQSIIKTFPETPKPLIKNSIFQLTKEELKKEITEFYCQEKNLKKDKLTKQDEKIIDELEEKILKKEITTKEEIKDEIEKLTRKQETELESKIIQPELTNKNDFKNKLDHSYLFNQKNSEEIKKDEKEMNKNIISKENSDNNSQSFIQTFTISNPIKKTENSPTLKSTLVNEEPQVFNSPIPPINTPISISKEKQETLTVITKENLKENSNQKTIKENNLNENQKQIQVKEQDKKEETPKEQNPKKKEEEKFITPNLSIIEKEISNIEAEKQEEKAKEFEDKNYDEYLQKINLILKEIEKLKVKKLKPEDRQNILNKENKLKKLKKELESEKAKDLIREENILQENITEQELFYLEEQLRKQHLENQIDLNNHFIAKAEDLENLSGENLKKIEKALIKIKIKKASKTLELPSILLLPFIRNRYFFMFTIGLLVNNHLNLLDNLLKHKSLAYESPNLEHIKKGSDALEEALQLTTTNISYLNNLEKNILNKYPELSIDEEYLLYINKLRYSLLKNEEKMLKKKKMIKKYNLKYQVKVRKLKKAS